MNANGPEMNALHNTGLAAGQPRGITLLYDGIAVCRYFVSLRSFAFICVTIFRHATFALAGNPPELRPTPTDLQPALRTRARTH
jgi:hypothetical protein